MSKRGTMQITNPDGTEARGTRTFAVSPSRMWQAFTDPADMAAWMWGGYSNNCVAESDLRVGGRYSVYTDSTATKDGWHSDRIGRLGMYVEIVPEIRLVYTLHWDAPVGYNQQGAVVTDEVFIVTFTPDDDGTLVAVSHLGIPDDGVSAVEHGRGLGEELEKLATIVGP
jgi:uncharacterized protein YndB with AHSA1/START domain